MFKITNKSHTKARVTYSAVNGCMNDGLWSEQICKRDVSRHFYEGCGAYSSGWMSYEALELPSKKRTKDHFISPQTYWYFLADNWDNYTKKWENFLKEWKFCSQTIAVTSEQNDELKGFTENIDGVIKVKVPILERYSSLGIELYSEKHGTNDGIFPFAKDLSEEFIEYEERCLLI
jgi:hypothetical protein